MDVYIRWMIRTDMPQVLKIEQAAFPFCPWSEEDFLRELRFRNCIGRVAEPGPARGPILGYDLYRLHADSLEIASIAVDPEQQGKGIGKAMVGELERKLSTRHRCFLTVQLRERNIPCLLFFRSQGFRAVRCVRGAYEDTGEDGIVMRYSFEGQSAAEMEAVSAASF